jgi:hypothetical protein
VYNPPGFDYLSGNHLSDVYAIYSSISRVPIYNASSSIEQIAGGTGLIVRITIELIVGEHLCEMYNTHDYY